MSVGERVTKWSFLLRSAGRVLCHSPTFRCDAHERSKHHAHDPGSVTKPWCSSNLPLCDWLAVAI